MLYFAGMSIAASQPPANGPLIQLLKKLSVERLSKVLLGASLQAPARRKLFYIGHSLFDCTFQSQDTKRLLEMILIIVNAFGIAVGVVHPVSACTT